MESTNLQLIQEVLQWRRCAEELPDSDTTVMVFAPDNDEPVWLGWYDADTEEWREIGAGALPSVTHWTDIPRGPTP